MRGDIQELESTLKATELRCVDPGIRSTSEDVYPVVKAAYPSLCDDSLRCEDVCSDGTDQPEWKHAVRRVQQQLADHDDSRVNRHPEYGMWKISHPDLLLIPVSDDWLPQYHSTVVDPVSNSYAADTPSTISPALPARIWGATEGPQTKGYFESMSPGDWLLFYHDSDFIGGGQVGRTVEDPSVGVWLWNNPSSRYIFTVTAYRHWGPAIGRIWDALGYDGQPRVQGFMRVNPDQVAALRSDGTSLEHLLYGPVDASADDADAPTDLSQQQLTDDAFPSRQTTLRDQLLRDQTTVNALKQQYEHTCQVCGHQLYQAPNTGYSEVHHLKPICAPHNGPDVPENMLVLCPNHHADFDNGMIAIQPGDYTIVHNYDETLAESTLHLNRSHTIAETFLKYHLDEIVVTSLI